MALHVVDVDTDPAAIRVVGKDGNQRPGPLSPVVGPRSSAPFGRIGNPPQLTGEAIRQILSRRTMAAGLAAMSPHDPGPTPATSSTPAARRPAARVMPPRRRHRAMTVAATRSGGRAPSGSTLVSVPSPGDESSRSW